LEHRASNPVSVKNLTAMFQWERRGLEEEEEEEDLYYGEIHTDDLPRISFTRGILRKE
jgi:hypothetical protein